MYDVGNSMTLVTKPDELRVAAAHAFLRSLNILVKSARMYGMEHQRTAVQYATALDELHAALPSEGMAGLTLGVSGKQLLIDGVPVETTPAENSFTELLSAGKLSSIHFAPQVGPEDFDRFVRTFVASGNKNPQLAEQLKAALEENPNATIRVNPIRYVAAAGEHGEGQPLSPVVAGTVGGMTAIVSSQIQSLLGDPTKLLQLIAAAQGSGGSSPGTENGEPAGGVAGAGRTAGAVPESAGVGIVYGFGLDAEGAGGGSLYSSEPVELITASESMMHAGSGPPAAFTLNTSADPTAEPGFRLTGPGGFAPREDDVMNVLRLLAKVGQASQKPGSEAESKQLRDDISQLQPGTQLTLQQALASLAAAAPSQRVDGPMLLQLAEHMAIQFALDSYERGETRVNSVKDMLGKMSKEIETLRKVLGGHEDKLKKAGINVESHAEALDRQFWASVPETGKRSMLLSAEAWCIPPRNVRSYLERAFQCGDTALANDVLRNFSACLCNPDPEARGRAATGMLDLADIFGRADQEVLAEALTQAGTALETVLREQSQDVARAIGEAFVRLGQQATTQKNFSALRDALELLSTIEQGAGKGDFARSLRARLSVEKQIPEFMEGALRATALPDGLVEIARQHPHVSAENLSGRVIRCGRKRERERLVEIAKQLGSQAASYLSEVLRTRPAGDAVSVIALLCRLDPLAIEEILPLRLREWNRFYHDMTVRQIAVSGAPERARLLLKFSEILDPQVFPGALDEVGMCGDLSAAPLLISIVAGDLPRFSTPFVRVKAIESLGRLRAEEAAPLLKKILESRQAFRWQFPREMRIVAAQALKKIDQNWMAAFLKDADLSEADMALLTIDPMTDAPGVRQRAYRRVVLPKTIEAKVVTPRADYTIEIRELSIGGGFGQSEAQRALPPGSEAQIVMDTGWRRMKAHVLVRDARSNKFAYEIVDIELEDRLKLRRLLAWALANNSQ